MRCSPDARASAGTVDMGAKADTMAPTTITKPAATAVGPIQARRRKATAGAGADVDAERGCLLGREFQHRLGKTVERGAEGAGLRCGAGARDRTGSSGRQHHRLVGQTGTEVVQETIAVGALRQLGRTHHITDELVITPRCTGVGIAFPRLQDLRQLIRASLTIDQRRQCFTGRIG